MASPKLINETLPDFYRSGRLTVKQHLDMINKEFMSKPRIGLHDTMLVNQRLIRLLHLFDRFEIISRCDSHGEYLSVINPDDCPRV